MESKIVVDPIAKDDIMEFYGLITGEEVVKTATTRGLAVKRQWWEILNNCKVGRAGNCLSVDVVVEAPYIEPKNTNKYEDKYSVVQKEWEGSQEGAPLKGLVNSNQLSLQSTYNEEENKLFLSYKDVNNSNNQLVVPIAIR